MPRLVPSSCREVAIILLCFMFSDCALLGYSSAQDNWPEFRGPSADGVAASAHLPDTIDETQVVWKTAIHGKGWSSPVVWGDQIWLTTATDDGQEMSALCVSLKSGKILFDLPLLKNDVPDFCHPMNSYASPTPVITEGHVFLHFGKYGTFCLDTETGKTIWSRLDLECNHFRGPASSPILFDGKLFVALDGLDQQYVVALDVETGETVWKKNREINYGTTNGDFKKAYGTGTIITVDNQPLLVYPSAVATVAYRPADGAPVWTVYHGGMNVSARPLQSPGGLIVIANGMGQMVGVKPDGAGDVTKSHLVWQLNKNAAQKTSAVIVAGLLYMVDDKGVISCVDPETGKTVWGKRVGGAFAASPIVSEGKIYFFDMDENIHVIRAGREFELVSKSKLGDGFMASPAVVGNSLILRSRSNLYRIEAAKSDSE